MLVLAVPKNVLFAKFWSGTPKKWRWRMDWRAVLEEAIAEGAVDEATKKSSNPFKEMKKWKIKNLLAGVRVILTHPKPHLDELMAIAILLEFGGMECGLEFREASEEELADRSVLKIGDGAGGISLEGVENPFSWLLSKYAIIDEHLSTGRRDDTSAVMLVAQLLRKLGRLPKRLEALKMWALIDSVHYGETHDRISATTLQAIVKSLWSLDIHPSPEEVVKVMRAVVRASEADCMPTRQKPKLPKEVMQAVATIGDLAYGAEIVIVLPREHDSQSFSMATLLKLAIEGEWLGEFVEEGVSLSFTDSVGIMPMSTEELADFTRRGNRPILIGFAREKKVSNDQLYFDGELSMAEFFRRVGLNREEIGLEPMFKRWNPAWSGNRSKGPQKEMNFDEVFTCVLASLNAGVELPADRFEVEQFMAAAISASVHWARTYSLTCPEAIDELIGAGGISWSDTEWQSGRIRICQLAPAPTLMNLPVWLRVKENVAILIQREESGNVQIFLDKDKIGEEFQELGFRIFRQLAKVELRAREIASKKILKKLERQHRKGVRAMSCEEAGLYLNFGSAILNGSHSHPNVKPLQINDRAIYNIVRDTILALNTEKS